MDESSLRLPPARWPEYLQRISSRYAGHLIILRQVEAEDPQPQVVLWRTPLRDISTEASSPGHSITIRAGEQEPFIELSLGLTRRLTLRFAPGEHLEAILIDGVDDTRSTLVFVEDGE
jgi:hypothetical protein